MSSRCEMMSTRLIGAVFLSHNGDHWTASSESNGVFAFHTLSRRRGHCNVKGILVLKARNDSRCDSGGALAQQGELLGRRDVPTGSAVGLSKATALEKVRANLGVEPWRRVVIGDVRNDLEMLRRTAHAVAMGNAPAVVREAADAVTGTFGEHGAAMALEALHANAHADTRPVFS